MGRIVKCLEADNGVLYGICGGDRFKMLECGVTVKIKEHCYSVPVLGKGRVITGRDIVIVITYDHKPEMNVERIAERLTGIAVECDVLMPNGDFERLYFADCRLQSDFDLTEGGSCEFAAVCTAEMIDKIRKGV